MFEADDRDVFRAAASEGEHVVDDATWQRAEAWALHFAVVDTPHCGGNRTMSAISNHLCDVLLDRFRPAQP